MGSLSLSLFLSLFRFRASLFFGPSKEWETRGGRSVRLDRILATRVASVINWESFFEGDWVIVVAIRGINF